MFTIVEQQEEDEKALRQMMKEYFSTEEFGVKITNASMTPKGDKLALDIMKKTLKYNEGRYEIGLLWKDPNVTLPNSYEQALRRLKTQEQKMEKDSSLAAWYHDKIKEYLNKGYARKATPYELLDRNPRINYIPHFSVVNPNKMEPKPRLVFDAAARNQGVSLNSMLLSGPDATTSLFGVLIRFREHRIGCSADIQEMFHQVRIKEEDQCAQRFLFRGSPREPPQVYVMQVMTFGATCSPACAQYVKNQNALKYKESHPKAVDAILRNHYVDDYLDSFPSVETAIRTVSEINFIHDQAHFFMRNYISNSGEIINSIPEERRSTQDLLHISEKEHTFEKVLGLYWDTRRDVFRYQIKDEIRDEWNKRDMLSYIMRIYDPLGLLSNYMIEGKIMMQSLWKTGLNWDEQISRGIKMQWDKWLKRIHVARTLAFPRCFSKGQNCLKRELHVFVDASEQAFAAVAYLRTVYETHVDVTIIAAKTRVAPTKPLSIPRLELQAAVLGVRLAETIKNEIRFEFNEEYFWSDSKTVLSWVNSEARNYKQFVAVRLGEILNSTSSSQWKWVASKDNPADEATKVIVGKSQWMEGPAFLKMREIKELTPQLLVTFEDIRPVLTARETKKIDWNVISIEWCSDWIRLRRAAAICLKYIDWLKSKIKKTSFSRKISKNDLDRAERLLTRKAQWEAYEEDINRMITKTPLSNNSSIRNLCPTLDEQGILRSKGRLESVKFLSYATRNPIILPKKHYLTNLIVQNYHIKYKHSKLESVIAAIRQKYWIIDIRAVLKHIINRCQHCSNKRAKPNSPMMAPLPPCRTAIHTKPFTHTGVDYFGPLLVTVGRSDQKNDGAPSLHASPQEQYT